MIFDKYAVVPKEVTDKMWRAGLQHLHRPLLCYHDMLSARPLEAEQAVKDVIEAAEKLESAPDVLGEAEAAVSLFRKLARLKEIAND